MLSQHKNKLMAKSLERIITIKTYIAHYGTLHNCNDEWNGIVSSPPGAFRIVPSVLGV
jgi:hypothetical protein